MEYLGLLAFIFVLLGIPNGGKIKKLERKIQKLERNLRGDNTMSKLITSLVGKKCILKNEEDLLFSSKTELQCTVLDCDDEWVKISYTDAKTGPKTEIIRIESIKHITLIEE